MGLLIRPADHPETHLGHCLPLGHRDRERTSDRERALLPLRSTSILDSVPQMAFCRGAKRPIEVLYSRVGGSVNGFSTLVRRVTPNSGVGLKDFGSSSIFGAADQVCYSSCVFLRRFAAATASSSSEQMGLIKQLRERTSAPMKEVKSALVDCKWDIEEAQKELRRRGVYLASKKSSRIAAEGVLALAQDERKAVVIELNCETDFVARNDIFQYLALSLAKLALSAESSSQQILGSFPVAPENFEGLKLNLGHQKLSGEKSFEDAVTEVAAMMGENVRLRRGFALAKTSPGVISTYLHASPQPGLGRLAGLLSLEVEDPNAALDALQRVGSEIAMHIVATKPLFLTKELVSSDSLESEKEILRSQAEASGKPKMAIEKIVEGRLRKYFEEVVLMEQKFFVNDTMNVKTVLANLSEEVGSPVRIGNFLRVEVGEGIQRHEEANESERAVQSA